MEATPVAKDTKTCYVATDDRFTIYHFQEEFYADGEIELTDAGDRGSRPCLRRIRRLAGPAPGCGHQGGALMSRRRYRPRVGCGVGCLGCSIPLLALAALLALIIAAVA